MKRIALLLIIICGLTIDSKAQQDGIGIGLILGYPATGISAKVFTGSHAFDAAAAWSLNNEGGYFLAWADYLVHNYSISSSLPWYLGVGGFVGFGRTAGIGARVPLGITYLFDGPFDIFVEIAHALEILPTLDLNINSGIGFRYYIR